MNWLRRTIGIVGVLLMLMSSMGSTVYAQEEGVAVPAEAPAGTDVAAGDDGEVDTSSDSTPAEGEGGDSTASGEPPDQTESVDAGESTSDGTGNDAGQPANETDPAVTSPVEDNPAEPDAGEPPADADQVDAPADGSSSIDADMAAPTSAPSSAASIGIQSHTPGPGDFNIEVQGLSVNCATTVSFTAVFTNTGGHTDVEASVMVRLFENQANWEADTAPIAIIGDSDDRIFLSPGSTPWSQTIWAEPQWFGTDSWYVTVSSYLVGYSPDGTIGRVQVNDSWTASVTGCVYESPEPPSPANASLACDGLLTHDALAVANDDLVSYLLYDPSNAGFVIDSTTKFPGSPHQFDLHGGQYDSLRAAVLDYGQGGGEWPTLAEASVTGCLGGDPDPAPDETGQISLSLVLEDAGGNPDTSADGATASWTVEPAGSVASNPNINGLRAAQTDPSTYTAIVSGGIASTTTGPLPLGSYLVCLDNTLTGGPNGDASIGDAPICDTVEVTEAGSTTPAAAAFTASIEGGSTDPDPGDGDGTALKVVSVTIDSPNLCGFMGGTATVTGTSQVEGYDSTMRADLSVGWETPGGSVTWGSAHQGPGGTWVDRVLEVNGPWSISKTAWDPVVGGKDVGVPRPADATAVFVTLELRERLTAEPDAALTVRYSLADCGSEPDPAPETGQIELTMSLVDGSGNPDTAGDGATVSWTVEPLDSFASNPNISSFRAAQSTVYDYSAVISGGVASVTSDPLPLGSYRVCLDHVLRGGPNGDLSIGDTPFCDIVELTEAGSTAPVAAAFVVSIHGTGSSAPDGDADKSPSGSGSTGGASSASSTSTVTGGNTSSAQAGQTATTLPVTGAGPHPNGGTTPLWLMVASMLLATAGFAIRRRATA